MLLEACVNSALSATEAENGGANRLELCSSMAEGGCTPSHGTILQSRKNIQIALFVMIRLRGGDFLYSDEEFEIMKQDISFVKSSGADGIVSGILNPDGTVDRKRMQILADLARPMQITFHRAFDMTADPFRAMDDLIDIGVDRILTSGQQRNALEGAPLIRNLIGAAADRIIIVPGGGIKEHNLEEVMNATDAEEFHMCLMKSVPSPMRFRREGISMGSQAIPEFETEVVDRERIRAAKEIMRKHQG
jgi:copper homeostasis protein